MNKNILTNNKINPNKVILVALHPNTFPLIGESQGICAISGYLQYHFEDINISTFDMQLHSLDEVVIAVKNERPAIIGISLKLQTLNQFFLLYKKIKKNITKNERPLIVIGNAIANYQGELLIQKYFNDIIVSYGEGEIVLYDLYLFVNGKLNFSEVRNIVYRKNNTICSNTKEDLDLKYLVIPDRTNTRIFYDLGGEIYIEGSRGCTYRKCSICSNINLTCQLKNYRKWRYRNTSFIVKDLKNLQKMKINRVTFTDEDFFGNNIKRIDRLASKIMNSNLNISFRINLRVKSVYDNNDSKYLQNEKAKVLENLKNAGLVKIFVGLESGVKTQLKRYKKNFRIDEFKEAIKLLKKLNIEYEVGYILIDPLLKFYELKESLNFLEKENIICNVSSIFKELRLQLGIPYINLLKNYEKDKRVKILGKINLNSLKYKVNFYIDKDVEFIVQFFRKWTNFFYKFNYLVRIHTQYINESNFSNDVIFSTILDFKLIEFDLLKKFVHLIENKGHDLKKAYELMLEYEYRRRSLVNNIAKFLLEDNKYSNKKEALVVEINKYFKYSDLYMYDINKIQ